jgi:hypothetical protein
MISPQATTIDYSAADGANVPKNGPLEVRNAFIVANESAPRQLPRGLVNTTSDAQTIHISSETARQSVRIAGQKAVSLGGDDAKPLPSRASTPAGETIDVYFQSGDAEGVKYAIRARRHPLLLLAAGPDRAAEPTSPRSPRPSRSPDAQRDPGRLTPAFAGAPIRDPGALARGQPSKRYPSPRTVTSMTGSDGFCSMRERIRLMCTSSVFVSPK